MNSDNRLKRIYSSRLGFSIITNVITLFVSMVLFHPHWEEIDDIWIAAFTEGAFGDNEPHVLFSNIIYGRILCLFQRVVPAVRWHAVFEILVVFVIAVAFVYVLGKDRRGRFLSVIFLMGVFYEVYVALQFSKTPAFIAMAGHMILFELCSDTEIPLRIKRILCLSVWISFFYAIILRSDAFLLATMVAGVYGIIRVVRDVLRKVLSVNIRKYIIYFAPVALIFVLCTVVGRLGYRDKDWGNFKEYQTLESIMIDYHNGALMYNDHADELEGIGVSENDAFMLVTWQFGDDEFLTEELLGKIIAIDTMNSGMIDIDMLKAWVANIHEAIFDLNPLVVGLVMVLGIFLAGALSGGEKPYDGALIASQVLLTVGILFYYQYIGRWSHRVVYALLITQFILFIHLLSSETVPEMDRTLRYCTIFALLFAIISARLTNEFDYRKYQRTAFDYDEIISYMRQNKDILFVADTFTLQDYDKYNIFVPAQKGQFDNLTLVGGSYTNSPTAKKITRSHGYENPFKALEGRDRNVILVDNLFPARKLQYCNEHGDGNNYVLKEIDTIGGLRLYNIL